MGEALDVDVVELALVGHDMVTLRDVQAVGLDELLPHLARVGQRDEAEHGEVSEAAEVGRVAAHERQKLGDHVAAGVSAAEGGEDTDECLVLDGLLGDRVREAKCGAHGGVEDEAARVDIAPVEGLLVRAIDVNVGERCIKDYGQEEQA